MVFMYAFLDTLEITPNFNSAWCQKELPLDPGAGSSSRPFSRSLLAIKIISNLGSQAPYEAGPWC